MPIKSKTKFTLVSWAGQLFSIFHATDTESNTFIYSQPAVNPAMVGVNGTVCGIITCIVFFIIRPPEAI